MRYLNVYSNVLLTKGANRMLISDLQKNTSEVLPLELGDLMEAFKSQSIEQVLSDFDEDSHELINEYIQFLLQKEYAFITDGTWDEQFIPMSFKYRDYTEISNIFIELEKISVLEKLIPSLDHLGVKHMVVLCYQSLSLDDFQQIEKYYSDAFLQTIEIYSLFSTNITKDFLEQLDKIAARITTLVFYNAPAIQHPLTGYNKISVSYCEAPISLNFCGKVDLKYFNTNQFKVLEAINHNSCLHKKIGIDVKGNIKNCPAMEQSFGNINDTTLEDAIRQREFKQYWNMTKADIAVCKDCEFRNICTDCRAYTEQTELNEKGLDISKPLKCGYDPYTSQWEEWSTHPLKQQAIHNYGMLQINK